MLRAWVLIFTAVLGVEVKAISLDEVLNSVDQHYPEIRAADAKSEAQDYLVTRARGAFDPVLSAAIERAPLGSYQNTETRARLQTQIPETGVKVGAEWSRLEGKLPVYDGDRGTGNGGRWRGFVEAPLLRDLVIDRARAGLQTSLYKYAETLEQARLVRLDTYRVAALAYWNWLAMVEKMNVYKNLLKIAEDRDKVIGTRVHRGESPRIDKIDNQRMIMQRKAQVTKATNEAQKASLVLGLFYRNDQGQPQKIDALRASAWLMPLADVGPSQYQSLRQNLVRHPLLKGMQAELEQKQVQRRLARYSVLPELTLKASYGEYLGGLPDNRDRPEESKLGLTFSMPLFFREARGASGAARLEVEATEQKLRLSQQKLEVDFEKATLETTASAEIYHYGFQEIEFSRQVEAAERSRFQHGDSSLLSVNLREQDTALAQVRAIDALLDFREKDLELKLISNTWVRQY